MTRKTWKKQYNSLKINNAKYKKIKQAYLIKISFITVLIELFIVS